MFASCYYLAIPFNRQPIVSHPKQSLKKLEPGGAVFLIFCRKNASPSARDLEKLVARLRYFVGEASLKEAYQLQDLAAYESLIRHEHSEKTLQEIHHRVKNNLLLIDDYVERDQRVLSGVLRGLANLHRVLYETRSQQIPAHKFVEELVTMVVDLYKGNRTKVRLHLDDVGVISDKKGGALCIIIVELLTNSFKHNEPSDLALTVFLKAEAIGWLQMDICDNGKGITKENLQSTGGIRLVTSWVRNFLHGEIEACKASQGTHWRITFPSNQKDAK